MKLNTTKGKLYTALMAAFAANAVYAQDEIQQLNKTVAEVESIERDAVIKTISSADIEIQQINSLEGLVRNVPGVTVSKGDDRWGSGGFSVRGLDEDRVAINVDGIPAGESLKYEGGQAYGYFKGSRSGVDTEALKQVEIIKGADSVLSGSGALAGAVNFTTKDASDFLDVEGDDYAVETKLRHASANSETMASLTLAGRLGDLESLLIYTHRDSNEYESYDMNALDVEGSAREIPNPRDNDSTSVLAKIKYNFTEHQSLELVASSYEQNFLSEEKTFNGNWYNNRIGDDTRKTERLGLIYNLVADTFAFDEFEAAVNSRSIDFIAVTDQYVTISIPPRFNIDEDRIDERSFDQELTIYTFDFAKELGSYAGEHKLSYGVEYQEKDIVNKQIRHSNSRTDEVDEWSTRNLGGLIPTAKATTISAYVLDTFYVAENTQIRLGLRQDQIEYDASADDNYKDDTGTLGEIDFSTTNWTIGIEQEITSTLSLEAGISTGFRVPTIEEMYITDGDADDWEQIPNSDLEVEEATNIDISLVGGTDAFSYRLGVWKSDYDNFIDYETRTGINTNTGLEDPDGFDVPVNSDEVEMHGFEVELTADLDELLGLQGFSTEADLAYTKGEHQNGDPVYSVQPLAMNWVISYENSEGWGARLTTSYTKEKLASNSYETLDNDRINFPLYRSNTATIWDLEGYYDFSDSIRLTAGIYNLGDKEYYKWDNVRFVDQGDLRPGIGVRENGIKRYSEPGRNFTATISVKF